MAKKTKKTARAEREKKRNKREHEQRLRTYYAQVRAAQKHPTVISIKVAVDHFKSFMTDDQWHRRKSGVDKYFASMTKTIVDTRTKDTGQYNNRMAYYAKWIDWYIYLAEASSESMSDLDEAQWSRVKPFFQKIGQSLDLLKCVTGAEQRIVSMLHGNDNNADSVLFELIVAIAYAERGWQVEFIPEIKGGPKTPDFKAIRGTEAVFVECKRLQKVTDYSEEERQAWLLQWNELLPELMKIGEPILVNVRFKKELSTVKSGAVLAKLRLAVEKEVSSIESPEFDLKLQEIDYPRLFAHLSKYSVKFPSAQLNSLIDFNWEPHASYTMAMDAKFRTMHGGGSILNRFVESVGRIYCARWECTAEASIDKKAKDIKGLLIKAVSQAPADAKTIIHIGYETLHGPEVEFERDRKILELVDSYDYGQKDIGCVFCHAIQPSVFPDGNIELAETTRFFHRSVKAQDILPGHQLLFAGDGAEIKFNETHWMQDSIKSLSEEY